MNEQEIYFDVKTGNKGDIGVIKLNRPKALNALSLDMLSALAKKLHHWQNDNTIKAVIIKGVGEKAFCAGGDIRKLYAARELSLQEKSSFFRIEYQLNAQIAHFPKPYISFLNGITMGGGCGVSLHGSHPVATEKLILAMPETKIGFFPDVGAAHFLKQCPHQLGLYLALTGNSIGPDDAAQLGIVNHIVTSDHLPLVEKALCETAFDHNDFNAVTEIINHFSKPPLNTDLSKTYHAIEQCFQPSTIDGIFSALKNSDNSFCSQLLTELQLRSPTALAVTFKRWQSAMQQSFNEIIQTDFIVGCHFLESHDFFEGIRAMVIDKDQNPQWQPSSIADVDVDLFFEETLPPLNIFKA